MTAGARVVSFDQTLMARGSRNGAGAVVVYATTDADAITMAKALFSDDSDADWANATVSAMAAGTDFLGWTLRVRVTKPDKTSKADVSYVGVGSDTIDLMAAGIVTALNAVSGIANAAYNSGSQVLTVTGAADNLGDHYISVQFFPPAAPSDKNTGVLVKQGVAVPGFVVSKVDGGASGAACTATLAADGYTIPKVTKRFKFAG